MPQTVYTTQEVEEIKKSYESKLRRLKADKEKVEREKELQQQKISRLHSPPAPHCRVQPGKWQC